MSTRQLLEIVKNRGLRVTVKDGTPLLIKPAGNQEVTDALLSVLKIHRDRIIELLKEQS